MKPDTFALLAFLLLMALMGLAAYVNHLNPIIIIK